jgi:2-polyprenyl-3-methyl-5-hydroxy-6-metoxy-1,4-benzoquinol methylase
VGKGDTLKSMDWQQSQLEYLKACPVCGSNSSSLLYVAQSDITFGSSGQWNLESCHQCNAAYLNPRPTPECIGLAYQSYYTHEPRRDWMAGLAFKDFLLKLRNGFYKTRYGYHIEPCLPALGWAIRFIPWLEYRFELDIRQIAAQPNGSLLDVGCGGGEFLTTMQMLGWKVQGLEPDAKAVELAHTKGIPVQVGTLETVNLSHEQFDVITLNHVIEHTHDPLKTLRHVWQLLKPGGRIYVATPNLASFGHQRFGMFWRGLEIPRHLVLFSTRGLQNALIASGFHVPKLRQALVAPNLFRVSRGLELGQTIDAMPKLDWKDLFLAIHADVHTIFSPWRGEYATLIGYKS